MELYNTNIFYFAVWEVLIMNALKCEMCGGVNLIKEDGYFVCQSCGVKYTVEEAKKLRVEIDRTGELDNLLQLARRARQTKNINDGYKYYAQITSIDPYNWEGFFYSVYFQAVLTYKQDLYGAASPLVNSIIPTLEMIKSSVSDLQELTKIMQELNTDLYTFSFDCKNAFLERLRYIYKVTVGANSDFTSYGRELKKLVPLMVVITDIMYVLGDGMLSLFGDTFKAGVLAIWKINVKSHDEILVKYNSGFADQSKEKMLSYCAKIKQLDPTYKPDLQSTKKSGCYVATAVYGSYDCPQVWTLRRFRDYTLAETWYGRAFIRTYYAISPTLVKWFGHTEWFKKMWRGSLDRMVANLNAKGVEDTPYEDKDW